MAPMCFVIRIAHVVVLAHLAVGFSLTDAAAGLGAPPTNPSTVSVLDFGAVADAKTDNTAAFARAVAAVSETGGVVLVPSGQYAFDGNLTIPNGVALVGTYQSPPCHDLRVTNGVVVADGSQLLPRGSRGNVAGPPFVTVLQSASVRGLTFWYPDVDPTVVPVPYPWTVALAGRNSAIMDVELLNSFNGIYAVNSPRHYIARVHGQPTNVGVYVDACHDIGRIENVHFNPWYSDAPAYLAWQQAHGVGFQLMDTDWEFVSNTFTISVAVGYWLTPTTSPSSKGQSAPNGQLLGIAADHCTNASVLIDQTKAWGVVITNGQFVAQGPSVFSDFSQVVANAGFNGTVKFVNCIFFGTTLEVVRMYGTGSVTFESCQFHDWDFDETGRAAVEVYGGQVSVRGSSFDRATLSGSPQIRVHPGSAKVLFADNFISGAMIVSNEAPAARVVVHDNLPDVGNGSMAFVRP